ncbi:MAG: glycosyltransferase, partial [Clostridia bacterium]|nr:glycosyltransferase [Clostridia bacterium]
MEGNRPMTTVVIPASDPGQNLLTLLRGLRRETDYRILVVDDGSGADSAETLRIAETYATVLRHPHPRGRGSALKTAFSHLYESGERNGVVVTADADGQYSVTDIRRVVNVAYRRGG